MDGPLCGSIKPYPLEKSCFSQMTLHNRDVEDGLEGRAIFNPGGFVRSVTLYQPKGPDCAHSILLLALPALGSFLRHCSYAFLSKDSRITLHLGPKHLNRKR
jgi:hypothetical protein